jgi:hypothetical protein
MKNRLGSALSTVEGERLRWFERAQVFRRAAVMCCCEEEDEQEAASR